VGDAVFAARLFAPSSVIADCWNIIRGSGGDAE